MCLKETYATNREGTFSIQMVGMVEADPVSFETREVVLEIVMEVHSQSDNRTIGTWSEKIIPKEAKLNGQNRYLINMIDEVPPVTIEMEAKTRYLLHTRMDPFVGREDMREAARNVIQSGVRTYLQLLTNRFRNDKI